MLHTLEELRSGKLQGIKELKISENLTSFPDEIFELADSLEILDLSHNLLSSLPKNMSRLKKLKIAFFSNNLFTSVPDAFKECENLYMLGLKANQIKSFAEDIMPLSISWLILTDNRLEKLPDSMGKLTKMKKFPLAGNRLKNLPSSMANCTNLELIRLSANNLEEIPSWLLKLPKLSWLAFSGNPCVSTPKFELNRVDIKDLEINELLGEGASGEIFKAHSKELNHKVAIKFFKGSVTSDGYAEDEMNACLGVGNHENLIKVIAKVEGSKKLGLLLEYIPKEYENLGNPPTFDTCTRDTYHESLEFSVDEIRKIAKAIASASAHLHEKNLMHGDLYSHNILINKETQCYLGDFGAASFYDGDIDSYEKIEIRAFGCLLEDMLFRCDDMESIKYKTLTTLKERCMDSDVDKRPLFSEVTATYL